MPETPQNDETHTPAQPRLRLHGGDDEPESGTSLVARDPQPLIVDTAADLFRLRGQVATLHLLTQPTSLETVRQPARLVRERCAAILRDVVRLIGNVICSGHERSLDFAQALQTTYQQPAMVQRYRNILALHCPPHEIPALVDILQACQGLSERVLSLLDGEANPPTVAVRLKSHEWPSEIEYHTEA